MMLSLKYFVMYLLLVFLCLLLRVTLGIGSFASSYQTICKDDDAFLIWPNIPANVRNKAVYKGETLAVAWSQEGGFTESPSYKGRLKQKGENAFWIIKANQSDSGTYKLIYNSPATDISEESFNLQVIVPPSNYCIPNITREQDTLWAKLPQDDCGIPMLKPKWMNGTEITIMGNIAVLNARVQPGTYIACANGTALQCYKGNSDTLCANYTLHEPDSKQESGSMMVTTIIVSLPISIFLIIVGVILICCFRWKSRRKKLSAGTVSERFEMIDVSCERQTLIRDETSAKDLVDIKRHLIHQYKALKSPDFSSSGKLKLPELSPMYFDLEITSLRMEHFGDRGNMSAASLQDIFSICKTSTNSAKHLQPIPAVIMGKCGIGKSTWCKKIVNEWCSYNGNMESNMNVGHTTIPEVARFEILLFVPLKYKLEGHSFADCLRHELFHSDDVLFVNTMNYMAKHGESVIIIIDGLDEVIDNLEPIRDLLKSKETFPCTTVITSRPDGLECLQKKEEIKLRLFQMHGFNLVKAQEFASKSVEIPCMAYFIELSAEQLWEGLTLLQAQTLFQVPLLCSSLVPSLLCKKALLDEITDFLLAVVECYVNHAKTRRLFGDNIDKVLKNNDFEIKIKDKIYSREYGYILQTTINVAKQMSLSLHQTAIEFRNLTREVGEDCVQLCVETGILVKTFVRSKTITVSHISFSHFLLFDFFAMLSLAMESEIHQVKV